MSIAKKFEVIADEVYEKGKKDEYDKFWDSYQKNGSRTDYGQYAFAGYGFDSNNLYPKYDIKPTGACTGLFYNYTSKIRFSLKQRLEECGVVLDTSKITNFRTAFAYNYCITEIPTLDLTSMTSTTGMFVEAQNLETIEKIIVTENTPAVDFTSCKSLENLIIEGTIGQNGFNVKACTKLSGASIVSIIEALSTTTSGLTVTLSQTAVDNMVFPIVGNNGTYNSWTDLEQAKTNWTISLL